MLTVPVETPTTQLSHKQTQICLHKERERERSGKARDKAQRVTVCAAHSDAVMHQDLSPCLCPFSILPSSQHIVLCLCV